MVEERGSAPGRSQLWFPFAHEIIRSKTWRALSKRAKAVYPVICAHADFTTGECFPSLATIEELSGIGRSWVAKALSELVEVGLIVRRSGDPSHSNRYRVIRWGSAATAPGQCRDGTTPDAEPAPGEVPQRHSNYTQVTIHNVTTPNNHYRRRSSGNGFEVPERIASQLGGVPSAMKQLEDLAGTVGPERLEAAYDEAVAQGHPTIKYMRGILRNWEREGRIVRSTVKEMRAENVSQERETGRSERREELAKIEREKEAYAEARRKLAECSATEILRWRTEAEERNAAAKMPPFLAERLVEQWIVRRAAEKFAIQGLPTCAESPL